MVRGGKHFLSIWFFIGALLLVYGVLILGSGIYTVFHPPERQVVMAGLHAEIWWGALLLLLGAVYSYLFFPRKNGR
jgi:hypothetical protein